MASRVTAVVIETREPEELAAFWAEVVGATSVSRWSDARGTRFVEVEAEPVLLFQESSDPVDRGALHIDVAPPAGTSQIDEVARLNAIGARVVADDADLPWVVLADLDGNRFCVLQPRGGPTSDG